jgi:hypothetical protein
MKHLAKIFGVLSAVLFVFSLTPVGSDIHYGILKPISAILFIVFYILHVTRKEVEQFDQEHAQGVRSVAQSARVRADAGAGKAPVSAYAR